MIEFGDLVDQLQGELIGDAVPLRHFFSCTYIDNPNPLYDLVYREQAKTDKSKKGSANINGASAAMKNKSAASASASTSISAAKSKGKEKGKSVPYPLPPPFTSIPLAHPQAMGSISTGPGDPMYVDEETMEMAGGLVEDTETEGGPEAEAEAEAEAEEEEEEEEEEKEEEGMEEGDEATGEELHDNMAVDEDELRRDARGLEEPVPVAIGGADVDG